MTRLHKIHTCKFRSQIFVKGVNFSAIRERRENFGGPCRWFRFRRGASWRAFWRRMCPADPVHRIGDRQSPHHEKGGSGGVVRILTTWCRLLFAWQIIKICAAERVLKELSALLGGRNYKRKRSRKCWGATPAWATIWGPGRPCTNFDLQCAPRGAAYPVPGNRISGSQNG